MGNVIYSMMVSLDGFIEGPDKDIDWVIADEELHKFINEYHRSTVGAYLLGRGMYETHAAYWPASEGDTSAPEYILEYGRIWRAMPKVVFSATLDQVVSNTRLVRDDGGQEVQKLKQQHDKDLWVGGAGLAASLMRLSLVDEYGLFVQPVLLGHGTPMFPRNQNGRRDMHLVEERRFASGVVYLRYRRAAQSP
jgi:dihydrofolate reductase